MNYANTHDLVHRILNQTYKHLFGAYFFCIKSILKILAKFLEKNLQQSLFLVQLLARTLTKIELLHSYFSMILPNIMAVTCTIFEF